MRRGARKKFYLHFYLRWRISFLIHIFLKISHKRHLRWTFHLFIEPFSSSLKNFLRCKFIKMTLSWCYYHSSISSRSLIFSRTLKQSLYMLIDIIIITIVWHCLCDGPHLMCDAANSSIFIAVMKVGFPSELSLGKVFADSFQGEFLENMLNLKHF